MPEMAVRENSLGRLAATTPYVPAAKLEILPDAAKFIFRGRPASLEVAGAAFGVALPVTACRFEMKGNRAAYWLGPDEWMLQAVGEDPQALFVSLETALAGHPHSLVSVSHRSDSFTISGPRAAFALNHGCPLDLSLKEFPVGMCTRTVFAKATIVLSRIADDAFHIDVWRSFAPYVWQLLDGARQS